MLDLSPTGYFGDYLRLKDGTIVENFTMNENGGWDGVDSLTYDDITFENEDIFAYASLQEVHDRMLTYEAEREAKKEESFLMGII